MLFEIERVTARNGGKDGVGKSFEGRSVNVQDVVLSKSLFLFDDYGSIVLQTSNVEAYNSEWRTSGHLTVQTRNTVYSLRKKETIS